MGRWPGWSGGKQPPDRLGKDDVAVGMKSAHPQAMGGFPLALGWIETIPARKISSISALKEAEARTAANNRSIPRTGHDEIETEDSEQGVGCSRYQALSSLGATTYATKELDQRRVP